MDEHEIELFRNEFTKELDRLVEGAETQNHWVKMIMPRNEIGTIVKHLKGTALLPGGKFATWVESRKFKVFNKPGLGLHDVLMEPTKEKLTLNETGSSGHAFPKYLRVICREDIFDTLLKIHLQNNHSTLRETVHLVRTMISNIPRYLIHKFILLCPICSNNGAATNSAGLPYTPSRRCIIKARKRRKLMDQFQVDILDLKGNPDGSYCYILHCMDHITGFHWLYPLLEIDAGEVAQILVWGIFALFGFPSELTSDYGTNFATEVIEEVYRLWPEELHIKNYLEGNSYKKEATRRNTRTITLLIDDMSVKKAALGDTRLKWSEWLPEIQFTMNATVVDVKTGKTPYEKVFRAQPITQPAKVSSVNARSDQDSETDEPHVNKRRRRTRDTGLCMDTSIPEQMVMEEVVGYDEVVLDDQFVVQSNQSGVESSGVVVVDVAGVEHHATPTMLTDTQSYETVLQQKTPSDGFESYTLLQDGRPTHAVVVDDNTHFLTDQLLTVTDSSITMESDQQHLLVSVGQDKLKEDHILDNIEYARQREEGDGWVTLSEDGNIESQANSDLGGAIVVDDSVRVEVVPVLSAGKGVSDVQQISTERSGNKILKSRLVSPKSITFKGNAVSRKVTISNSGCRKGALRPKLKIPFPRLQRTINAEREQSETYLMKASSDEEHVGGVLSDDNSSNDYFDA